MAEKVLIHNINKIFECREYNYKLPRELEKYCINKYQPPKSHRESTFIKIMNDITNALTIGVDPNETTFMNVIRREINKLNFNNYEIVSATLKALNFHHENHFVMLAKELVFKSMNDIVAVKGNDVQTQQPSELYTNLILEFSSFFIEDKDKPIKFKTVFAKICQRYFREFLDTNMKMDKNNQHRINNFKGFMNMIGLLYVKKCFGRDVVMDCLTKVTDIILKDGMAAEECDNYYAGYERLSNQILCKFELDTLHENVEEFEQIYEQLTTLNNKILSNSKILRRYSNLVHEQYINRLETINRAYHSRSQ